MSGVELAPGTVVGGRYTVTSTIGRGERSTTYRASTDGASEVALKVYQPALPTSELDAVRRAGEAAAALTSAALAPLDAGADAASGVTFAVQELSARPSLAQLVELCPLAPADAVALARSLARALGPLHERGIAHGALAPSNVFVGPPPACEVRLSDFVALGHAQAVATAVSTDVQGVARVVCFALTGRFSGSAGSAPDAAWNAVFRRAVHPRPGEAYGSVDALADALERASRGEAPPESPSTQPPVPLAVAAPPVAAPPFRPARRVPFAWIGAGLGACLVLAVGGVLMEKLVTRTAVAAAPSATPSAVPSAAAVESTEPAGSAPATPPAPPEDSSVALAPPPPPPPPPEPALPPHDHWHALLVVACKPSCDSVFIDGHLMVHPAEGQLLAPGVHTVAANLANHRARVQDVLLRGGRVKKLNVSF